MQPRLIWATWLAFIATSVGSSVSLGGDWPNFLGPRYDGKSAEKGLKTNWAEPLKLVWEREVGSAFSSFACVGNRLYTCGEKDKQQVLYCLTPTRERWSGKSRSRSNTKTSTETALVRRRRSITVGCTF